jgi:phospholipase/carboxylesterase
VLISHGRLDPVIPVQFGQQARDLLEAAGLTVDYREFEGGHNVDPRDLPRAIEWLQSTLGSTP